MMRAKETAGKTARRHNQRRAARNKGESWGIALDYGVTKLKPRKRTPYVFVMDALAGVEPRTRPMFGCTAVYVREKIVLILREKGGARADADDGVWLATSKEHHESLRREFPSMRSVRLLGNGRPTNWQVLPAEAPDFESAALRACELVAAGDPRIGRVPKSRRKR
jgi:hypothetical protein